MRIALVSEHADPGSRLGGVDAGGQNVHVGALAAHLVAQGHDVVVSTRRTHPGEGVVRDPAGFRVEHLPMGPARELPKDDLLPHVPQLADALVEQWRRWRPDVVHAHFWMSGLAAVEAAAALDLPVALTFHALGTVKRREQGADDTSPAGRIGLEARLARRVDRVVATCSDEVHELLRMGADRRRVSVVPCGVDTDAFRPDAFRPDAFRPDARPGAGERVDRAGEGPRLLTIGRMVPRKGVRTLLEALPEVPGALLDVAGGPSPERLDDDPEITALRDHARRCGVADRVRFLGAVPRPRVPALMARADAVVTVPWYEPFGLTPIEAMAAGRPVVGSAVGGLLDTVVPGVTGELVPPRRPDLLAAALRDLLADPARCARYGRAGRERAVARYDWRRVAACTAEVYADLAGAAGPRPALTPVPTARSSSPLSSPSSGPSSRPSVVPSPFPEVSA